MSLITEQTHGLKKIKLNLLLDPFTKPTHKPNVASKYLSAKSFTKCMSTAPIATGDD